MPARSRKIILLATDQQRSVLNALDESRPNPIAYTPYGHRRRENGLLSLLGFNGELPDPMTGHYHLGNGYRQFNPVLMRFNSPDSWSPFGRGGLNAYGYCAGDPVNREDRTGRAFDWLVKPMLGFQRRFNKTLSRIGSGPAPYRKLSGASTNTGDTPGGAIATDKNSAAMEVVSGNDGLNRPHMDLKQAVPKLPPRPPSLSPPRPLIKPDPRPPHGFTIIGETALITLPYEKDHQFVVSLPLSHASIIELRKAGVHIHPDLLARGFGEQPVSIRNLNSNIRNQAMHQTR